MALVLATSVAVLAAAVLQISAHFTRRQLRAEHDTRAFYLAEAGLSEAYFSLTSGGTGQIGSMASPVRSGDGVLWVEATDQPDNNVRLECTALCGLGRAALAITVERVEQPLGIFADQDIVVDSPLLIDGYDSRSGDYSDQIPYVLSGKDIKVPYADWDALGYPAEIGFVGVYKQLPCQVVALKGNVHVQELLRVVQAPAISDPVLVYGSGGTTITTLDGATTTTTTTTTPTSPVLGAHTDGGGMLASNGSITFLADSAVFGDVIPGPNGQVVATPDSLITGAIQPRAQRVELEAVVAPTLELLPAVEHGGAVPLVIAPTEVGYQGLRVLSGAELVLRGPSTVLVGALEVQNDALLTVDNLDGRVDLFVTQSLDLAPGSLLSVASVDPNRLTLQVVGSAGPIRLAAGGRFRGLVYAPEAHVEVVGPFELFGVLAVRSLDLGAGARLHYDSGFLGSSGPLSLPKLLSWEVTEVPAALRTDFDAVLQVLGKDPSSLQEPQNATLTAGWTATVKFWGLDGKVTNFSGPYEAFDYAQMMDWVNFELTPPSVPTADPWLFHLRYLDFWDKELVYDGTMDAFSHFQVRRALDWTLTPPAELQAKGYQVIYRSFL